MRFLEALAILTFTDISYVKQKLYQNKNVLAHNAYDRIFFHKKNFYRGEGLSTLRPDSLINLIADFFFF